MAFTFNWARGQSIPTIKGGDNSYQQTIRNDAANWGSALRGYETRKANQEYADMLGGNVSEIAAIKAEIAALEKRNAELASQAASELAAQQMQSYNPQAQAQAAAQQMQGYGAYMQGMQDQGYGAQQMQAGPILEMMYRRTR